MITQFFPGDRVAFDDAEHGPQTGRLIGFVPDISNGNRAAVVEVDHALSGMTWMVELHKLERERLAA
jgi:hypothetical protein